MYNYIHIWLVVLTILFFFSMGRIISYIMEVIKFHGLKPPTRHIYIYIYIICCNPVTSTYIELVRISPTRPAPHSSSPWHPNLGSPYRWRPDGSQALHGTRQILAVQLLQQRTQRLAELLLATRYGRHI